MPDLSQMLSNSPWALSHPREAIPNPVASRLAELFLSTHFGSFEMNVSSQRPSIHVINGEHLRASSEQLMQKINAWKVECSRLTEKHHSREQLRAFGPKCKFHQNGQHLILFAGQFLQGDFPEFGEYELDIVRV